MSLRDRTRRSKVCKPLMSEGFGELKWACPLCSRTAANFEKKKIFLEILQVFSVLRRIISEEQKTGY